MSSSEQQSSTPAAATPASIPFDNIPGPGSFNGRSNGLEWLKKFELWARCRQLSDDTKLAALQLHLVDAAATWTDVLHENQKDTWTHFKAAFVARYEQDQHNSWQRAGQLWSARQTDDERVMDFIDRVQLMGRECNVPDNMQMSAIVNGMRSSLRSHILRQNPADLTALRQAARIAEHNEQYDDDKHESDAIQRIEQRLDNLTLHLLSAKNMDYRNDQHESPPVERQQQQSQSSPRFDRRGRQHEQPNYRSPSPAFRRQTVRPSYVGRRVTFNPAAREQPTNRSTRSNFPPCDSCGRTNHRREQCYFRLAECAACHRVGHLQQVCRSASQ
jgi:ribosomal protein S15P/S13E